jgi:hypothetical protein
MQIKMVKLVVPKILILTVLPLEIVVEGIYESYLFCSWCISDHL